MLTTNDGKFLLIEGCKKKYESRKNSDELYIGVNYKSRICCFVITALNIELIIAF